MPMGRHFDLAFGADSDHVQATLLFRISRDDGHFNAGYERLPDQLAWRDCYMALRESKGRYQQDRSTESRTRDSDERLWPRGSHGHLGWGWLTGSLTDDANRRS